MWQSDACVAAATFNFSFFVAFHTDHHSINSKCFDRVMKVSTEFESCTPETVANDAFSFNGRANLRQDALTLFQLEKEELTSDL